MEAPEAAEAAGVRPPRPSNWGDMSRRQRQHWKLRSGRARWDSHGGGMWDSRVTRPSNIGGRVGLLDSARERKTKRAQWLRDPHSFEPGVIPRLASF